MNFLNQGIENQIDTITKEQDENYCQILKNILLELYKNIPDNKRISYGRVHTLKVLVKGLTEKLKNDNEKVFLLGKKIYETCDDYMTQGTGLGLITNYGLGNFETVQSYIIDAAKSEHWDMREFVQIFFRKLIKKYPNNAQKFLLKHSKSTDANIRRFVSETLRPLQEKKWIQENTSYSLRVLENLFAEKVAYPRTSVGNNLSDLARRNPEVVMEICKSLVETKDKNSYWIAYRACRNLVKIHPTQVMDILGIDEYKYKTRKHKRSDYK